MGIMGQTLGRRDEERTLAAEICQELKAMRASHTDFMARMGGELINDTLKSRLVTFDSSGAHQADFAVAAGSMIVTNLSTGTPASTAPASTNQAAPAAGAEQTITVPAGQTWQLGSLDFTLVTSATVGNRTVQVTIDDGTNVVYRYVVGATQAASLTWEYSGAAGGVDTVATRAGTNPTIQFQLPAGMMLGAGWHIRTVTLNLQVGDQYSAFHVGYALTTAAVAGANVTVVSGPAAGSAPGGGPGVYIVAPGATRSVPLASRMMTLYGAQGQQAEYQVFTRALAPMAV